LISRPWNGSMPSADVVVITSSTSAPMRVFA